MGPGSIGLLQGVSDTVNLAGQFGLNWLQNKQNRKMAEYQYSKDLEMWNRANEYNLPVHQVERLKQAGLNPYLAYGQGTVTSSVGSGQLPKYQAPQMRYEFNPLSGGLDILSRFQDMSMKQAQTENIKQANLGIWWDNYIKFVKGNRDVLQLNADIEYMRDNAKSKNAKLYYDAVLQKNAAGLRVLENKFMEDTYANRLRRDDSMTKKYSADASIADNTATMKQWEIDFWKKHMGEKTGGAGIAQLAMNFLRMVLQGLK